MDHKAMDDALVALKKQARIQSIIDTKLKDLTNIENRLKNL